MSFQGHWHNKDAPLPCFSPFKVPFLISSWGWLCYFCSLSFFLPSFVHACIRPSVHPSIHPSIHPSNVLSNQVVPGTVSSGKDAEIHGIGTCSLWVTSLHPEFPCPGHDVVTSIRGGHYEIDHFQTATWQITRVRQRIPPLQWRRLKVETVSLLFHKSLHADYTCSPVLIETTRWTGH